MAKVVKDPKFGPMAGRPAKYDWDKWLDGQAWLIEEGVDYSCSPTSFRGYVRNQASSRGLRVRTVKHEDGLVIQVFPQ